MKKTMNIFIVNIYRSNVITMRQNLFNPCTFRIPSSSRGVNKNTALIDGHIFLSFENWQINIILPHFNHILPSKNAT